MVPMRFTAQSHSPAGPLLRVDPVTVGLGETVGVGAPRLQSHGDRGTGTGAVSRGGSGRRFTRM